MKPREIRRIKERLSRLGFDEARQGFRFKVGDHVYCADTAATNGKLTAVVAYALTPVGKMDEMVGLFNLVYYWSQRLSDLVLVNTTTKVEPGAPSPSDVREGPVGPGSRLNREAFEIIELRGTITVGELAKKLGLSKKTAGSWLSRWVRAGYLFRGVSEHVGGRGRPCATYSIGPKWWGEKVFYSERTTGI